MRCGIYMILCSGNGKAYVGQSINIRARWVDHRKRLNKGNHYNPHMQNSWNKYGADSFSFWIVHECQENELSRLEQEVADYLKDGGASLFNMGDYVSSPARGRKRPDNSKRLKAIHANPVLGPRLRRGVMARAEKLKGSEEARRNAEKTFAAWRAAHPRKPKIRMTPEQKKKNLSERALKHLSGKYVSSRPIMIIETGEKFDSVKLLATHIGTTSPSVCYATKNKTKLKGFSFKYLSNGAVITNRRDGSKREVPLERAIKD